MPTNADRAAAAPRTRQNGLPPRLAALSTRCGLRFGLVEKLKIPCPAGFRPVRKDDQAVGVTAGMVERSGPNTPSRASREMVGSFPFSIRSRTRSWSAPSRPRQSSLTRDPAQLGDPLDTLRAPRARRQGLRSKAGGGEGWPRETQASFAQQLEVEALELLAGIAESRTHVALVPLAVAAAQGRIG